MSQGGKREIWNTPHIICAWRKTRGAVELGREVKGAERGRGLGGARRVLTKNGESSGAGKMSLQQKYGPKGGMK